MRTKIRDLVHSLVDSAFEFAKENPRLIAKGFCKIVVATTGALAVAFATHGFPLTGGTFGAISAGSVALDGFMSNSQGKGGDQ